MLKYMHVDVSSMMKMSENSGLMSSSLMSSMGGMSGQVWQEMLSGDDGQPINSLLKKQPPTTTPITTPVVTTIVETTAAETGAVI
jgi:hypothetical protein